jgi:NADH-quinone oxidoreductase subunit L
MRNMGGLRKHMPITWVVMWVATLAISGVWPFAGFFSKDEIIWQAGAFGGAAHAPYPRLYTFYWILALAAALLTAFYMTRLMVMTFHGTNRTGAEESRHLHETSPVMWIPLTVLAFLSLFGGWLNVPEKLHASFLGGFGALPMGEWMHHWLEPVTAAAQQVQAAHLGELSETAPFGGGEVTWGVISFLLAVAVIVVAARWVGGKKTVTAAESPEDTGFAKVLFHKWYVDELYDTIVVQPIMSASRFCWKVIDAGVIDGTVNGVGYLARGVGWFGSLFQTGSVNTYAFILSLGVLVILGVVIF